MTLSSSGSEVFLTHGRLRSKLRVRIYLWSRIQFLAQNLHAALVHEVENSLSIPLTDCDTFDYEAAEEPVVRRLTKSRTIDDGGVK